MQYTFCIFICCFLFSYHLKTPERKFGFGQEGVESITSNGGPWNMEYRFYKLENVPREVLRQAKGNMDELVKYLQKTVPPGGDVQVSRLHNVCNFTVPEGSACDPDCFNLEAFSILLSHSMTNQPHLHATACCLCMCSPCFRRVRLQLPDPNRHGAHQVSQGVQTGRGRARALCMHTGQPQEMEYEMSQSLQDGRGHMQLKG